MPIYSREKVTVALHQVSKTYRTGQSWFPTGSRGSSEVQALKPLSLAAFSGEAIGLVGTNGSGKSTLLRMIAGNEHPSTGQVLTSSTPTLLSVNSALQPSLSGLDNVRLGLLASGMQVEEVDEKQLEVAEWAEIGEAINRPMSTYSSGMRSRLIFSISTAMPREILLVDEALATGDATFAAKAKTRLDSFLESSGTLFMVAHGSGELQKYCNRAIWLNDGELIADSTERYVTRAYNRWTRLRSLGKLDQAEEQLSDHRKVLRKQVLGFASTLDKSPSSLKG